MTTTELDVWIAADRERVFDAITTREGIDGWWGPALAAEPKKGSVVELDHSLGDLFRFEVTELVPNERVVWTCVSAFDDPSNPASEWRGQRLTFELAPRQPEPLLGAARDVTVLRFTQTWPDDARWRAFCTAAWGQVFNERLVKLCEEEGPVSSDLTLTTSPSVKVGLLMRTSPERAFEALRDPAMTTKFWYTKSTGKMEPGTTLRWDWEMYGASSEVIVDAVEQNRRIAFAWSGYDPDTPTHVEFRFDARLDGTYIEITETGFSGDADTLVGRVTASTQGFTFLLSSMKAYLEHDLLLHLTEDAHPDRRVA